MSYAPRQDPDLEFLKDRELLEIASLLSSRRLPDPPLDPAFRSSLRRQLRRQHYEMLETSLPWWRRLFAGPSLAWSGAVAGIVLIAVAVLFAVHPGGSDNTLVVSSPLDHMRNVAVVQPMELQFAQPMDHQSVESALSIEPATQVTYTWQGNTLLVQPAAGQLAPNTQYRVTLAPTAASTTGHAIGKATTITFVTAPPPAPAPSASPTPQPAGIAIGTPVQLGPANGGVTAAWSADSSTLYYAGPDDSLQSVPAAGGTPVDLRTPAVEAISVGNDVNGSMLAVLSADAATTMKPDATAQHRYLVTGGLAVGWYRPGEAVVALPAGVYDLRNPAVDLTHPLVKFSGTAQQAAFSPDGSRVLYLDQAGQVHLVDIQAGKDTAWTSSTAGLPVWSQDGTRVAFVTLQGVETAAPDGSGTSMLASLDQLGVKTADGITLAWSGGSLLAATPAGLSGIDTTLRNPVQLSAGTLTAPSASPDHQGLAYVQNGSLYLVALQRPGAQDQLLAKAEAVLQPFMDARVAGDPQAAGKYLDAAGEAAYAKGTLVYSGQPHLSRWFPVFVQAHPDGTVVAVVRLVLADGNSVEQSQLDETITLLAGADGNLYVDGAIATPPRKVDAGPELLSVGLTGRQLTLQFDSDLDSSSLAGIGVAGPAGQAVAVTPGYANRTVTIDLGSATPGTLVQVTISTALKDVAGRGLPQSLLIPVLVPSS